MPRRDPWLSYAQAHDRLWTELETDLQATTLAALSDVLAKLWRQVLGGHVTVTAAADGHVELSGLDNTARTTWRQALERWVRPVAYAYWRRKYSGSPAAPIDAWWARVLTGMLPTSDRIVEAVKDEIRNRPVAGIPELRDHIARVLGMDATTRTIRAEIEAVEAKLAAGSEQAARLNRRTTLLAELFRVQAARARSAAYGTLARLQPYDARQFEELVRQLDRQSEDVKEQTILHELERLDEQLYAGRTLSDDERTDLLRRRRELYEDAAKDEETWRNRATVAARTLSTDVLNEAAQQQAYADEREQGIDLVKVWIAAQDTRTRPTHRAAHGQMVGAHDQFHVGEALMDRPGDPDAPLDEVIQCRCTAAYLTRAEHEEIASALTAAATAGGDVTETPLEDLPPVMWHGVIAREGVYADDGRFIEPGATRTQPLPFPARFQRSDIGGHDGAVVIGNTEGARRFQGEIRAWGTFADGSLTPEVDEIQGLMATRMMRGNSIDGANVLESSFELHTDEQGNVFEHYSSLRLRATTFVAVPAFADAEVFLGPPPPEWLMEGEPLADTQDAPDETTALDLNELVAAVSRMPENLAEYWSHGEGAAKIGWGRPGDFDRCRRQLAKYVNPGQLSGVCANLHHRALGVWPGREAASLTETLVAAVSGSTSLPIADRAKTWDGPGAARRVFAWADGDTAKIGRAFLWRDPEADPTTQAAWSLGFADVIDGTLTMIPRGVAATAGGRGVDALKGVSAADKDRIRRKICTLYGKLKGKYDDWPDCPFASLTAAVEVADEFTAADFAPVPMDGPTPITITDDGHVYGHLAAWGTCHTGFSDVCVQPPKSRTSYALFHQGAVQLANGDTLRVGKLTVHAGHAKPTLNYRAATAHYDNSALAAAAVRAYEDEWGIAVSGMVIPGTPLEVVEELRLSPLSGDWREYDGNLELVAALGVNVPGFPIVGTENGRQVSLAAAGVVQPSIQERISATVLRMAALRVRELASTMNPTGGGQ